MDNTFQKNLLLQYYLIDNICTDEQLKEFVPSIFTQEEYEQAYNNKHKNDTPQQ